eukprot:scaffold41485_cov51-Phaeocystis_antarctica.AAC.2
MPRIVAVLPVPGGPWIRLTPRPQSAARMAASCDGLYRLSMARSSAAGGCSDCGAADSLAALPGESSAGASDSSGTEYSAWNSRLMHGEPLQMYRRQPRCALLGQIKLEGERAGRGAVDEGECVELLRHKLAVVVDPLQVELLVADEHQVGVEVQGLGRRLGRRLKVGNAEGLVRLATHGLQLQLVLRYVVTLQAAQRLRATLLEQQRLEHVEVLVDRAEVDRHLLQLVHGLAREHGVHVPPKDLLVHVVKRRVKEATAPLRRHSGTGRASGTVGLGVATVGRSGGAAPAGG